MNGGTNQSLFIVEDVVKFGSFVFLHQMENMSRLLTFLGNDLAAAGLKLSITFQPRHRLPLISPGSLRA